MLVLFIFQLHSIKFNMRLLILVFCVLLQCCSVVTQVYFSQPSYAIDEVIMGGIPFIVLVHESISAPYFSQMTEMNLLLLSGSDTSPMTLYSWFLNDTNPSTVANSIIFPPSIGPNASNAYFLGIRGALKANTSIYATYYSTRFTLMNMTGTQLLDAYTTGNTVITAPSLHVACGEPTGPTCSPTELSALSTQSAIFHTVSSGLGPAAPIVTSPPVGTAYAASTLTASFPESSATRPTVTATNTLLVSSPTTTSAFPASTSSAASTTTLKMLPAMVYPVIIAGLSLTATCVLFYIYSQSRRRSHLHHGKGDFHKSATWWDKIPMPTAMRRSRVGDLDAEKGAEMKAVELEDERARRELGAQEKGTTFELDGGLGNIKKVIDVVVTSERIQVEDRRPERKAGRVDDTGFRTKGLSPATQKVANPVKAAAMNRDLPPLPTDQGEPSCRKEVIEDCETTQEARRKAKRIVHYSVGPDGSYNYL